MTDTLSSPANSPTALHHAIGISVSYASMLLSGKKIPPLDLALRIWEVNGLKLGRLAEASDDDIAVLRRLAASVPGPEGGAAPPPFSSACPSSSGGAGEAAATSETTAEAAE
jgi:hypothetical protein